MTEEEICKAFYSFGQLNGIIGQISNLGVISPTQKDRLPRIFDILSEFINESAHSVRVLNKLKQDYENDQYFPSNYTGFKEKYLKESYSFEELKEKLLKETE